MDERYDSILSIIGSLKKIKDSKGNLEIELNLADVLRGIFFREGIVELEIKNENIDLIIEKLVGLDEKIRENEDKLLKEAADLKETAENNRIEDSAVPVGVIRKLVDEYELYLANGVSETEALKLLGERNRAITSRVNVENAIKRLTQIYSNNLKKIENKTNREIGDSEKETARVLALEQLVLEKTMEEDFGYSDVSERANEVFDEMIIPDVLSNKELMDKDKSKKVAEKIGVTPDMVKSFYDVSLIKVQINQKTNEAVDRIVKMNGAAGYREAVKIGVGRMINRIAEDKNLNINSEVKKTSREINNIVERSGVKIDSDLNVKIETAIKATSVEVDKWINLRAKEFTQYRREKLRDEIYTKVVQDNPNIDQKQEKTIKEYGKLSSEILYYASPSVVEANKEVVDEKTSKAYSDLKGLYSILRMKPGEFNKLVYGYTNIKNDLKNLKLPLEIRELQTVDGLMSLASEVPEIKNLIMFTQRYLRVYETVNKVSGGFLDKVGFKKIAVQIKDSVGGQATKEFITNSLRVFSEQGIKKGATAILKGIISGGVKAGVGGAVEAGAGVAASGGVAGAVAAFQAIPVVGQVILVLALAYAAYRKIIRPILKGVETIFRAMGVDFDKMKAFFQDVFGKVMGGVISFGVKAGILIIGIPAAISTIAVSAIVTPVVIFTFVGIFFYSMMNDNLVSSLVPPKMAGTGGGETDPTNPDLTGECSVSQNIIVAKQCDSRWSETSLPSGCTICKMGCGPVSVSMMTQKKNSEYTVTKLLEDPLYSGVGCNGSSISENASVLSKYLGSGAVTYNSATLGCTTKDIAKWICDGKIVLIGAQFFNSSGTGGHFVLGVAVDKGEIVSADPYYGTRTPFNGDTSYGHADLSQSLFCLLVDPTKY